MNIRIYPSKVKGAVTAPPSKSMTHRAIILASLARGKSVIKNALISDDTLRTIYACRALGVKIKQKGGTLVIEGRAGQLMAPKRAIDVDNSGTTRRLMTAVAALAPGKTILTGSKSVLQRPIEPLSKALDSLAIAGTNGGKIITARRVEINATVSSQFVSALLLIAPFSQNGLEIIAKGAIPSKPYVDLTIKLMRVFGVNVQNQDYQKFIISPGQYRAANITIEGDFSSASYFFAAAAVSGGDVTVTDLNIGSLQGDLQFVTILKDMGCQVTNKDHSITVKGATLLRGLNVDMEDLPDTVQTLSAVACYARGETQITNIGHLIYKETDRIADTAKELGKIGIHTSHSNNSLIISGGRPQGGTVDTHNDHRMAMSMAIAALGTKEGVVIKNTQVVGKSYPSFWQDLQKIGVKMEVVKV